FSYGDTAFLFTGDAYAKQVKQMMDEVMNIEADFVQLGHHGSDTSTSQSYLDEVNLTYAIYSAGKGNYDGHPHREVVDRLEASDIETYRTDVHGNIVVTTDGVDSEINTDNNGEVVAGKKESDQQDTSSNSSSSKSSSSTPEEKETPSGDCVDINIATKDERSEERRVGKESRERSRI